MNKRIHGELVILLLALGAMHDDDIEYIREKLTEQEMEEFVIISDNWEGISNTDILDIFVEKLKETFKVVGEAQSRG